MLNEESIPTQLAKKKNVNHAVAVHLLHDLYSKNEQVLGLISDHNKDIIDGIYHASLSAAEKFDDEFALKNTCLSIAHPIYTVYENTPTKDRRVAVSEAITKGVMKLRDNNFVTAQD